MGPPQSTWGILRKRASKFQKNEGIHIAKAPPLVTSFSALASPYPFGFEAVAASLEALRDYLPMRDTECHCSAYCTHVDYSA